ncbi:hypothetical protein CLG96_06535 [Sphingomonas oleivorans]|uniref:DUF4166 domain-containing protein n=1 Tax=Sphingomonas oleivorans TaxID=1735121 RepID=A0A2T5FZS1_9SPHN|nr:DUF4166 domain-containing protein [Sphingomonas oleivorans]PTQ12204.1 hypothetical protein CLG96_06535 [Sphingomonas oleivorans]
MVNASLFRRLLGPAMDALPAAVRAVHDADADLTLAGRADIWVSRHPLARLLCRMMRLPAAGKDVPTLIRFSRLRDGEHWHRTFGQRSYSTRLVARDGLLVEHMGPATNIFRLSVADGALRLDLIGFRFLGLPLPRALRPACAAIETQQDGAFAFAIPVDLLWLGPIIRYSGRLAPIERR